MSKSALYAVNSSSQAFANPTTISFGSVVRRFGCNCNLSSSGIKLSGSGYYDVSAFITGVATTAGTVTATMYKDGTTVSGATATTTVSEAGDYFYLDISALLREYCCESSSIITVVITGTGAGSITAASAIAEKL